MQIQVYNNTKPNVKLELLFERYDYICPRRDSNVPGKLKGYCPECYAVYCSPDVKWCERCLPKKIELLTEYFSYGKWRKYYNHKVAELWGKKPLGIPVLLDIKYIEGSNNTRHRDLDNIISMVYGLLSGSVIADDKLIFEHHVIKFSSPVAVSKVTVDLHYFDPCLQYKNKKLTDEQIAALAILAKDFAGGRFYIPKRFLDLYRDCEIDLDRKLEIVFDKVPVAGSEYQYLRATVRKELPEIYPVSNRRIIKLYREYREALKESKNAKLSKKINPTDWITADEKYSQEKHDTKSGWDTPDAPVSRKD